MFGNSKSYNTINFPVRDCVRPKGSASSSTLVNVAVYINKPHTFFRNLTKQWVIWTFAEWTLNGASRSDTQLWQLRPLAYLRSILWEGYLVLHTHFCGPIVVPLFCNGGFFESRSPHH